MDHDLIQAFLANGGRVTHVDGRKHAPRNAGGLRTGSHHKSSKSIAKALTSKNKSIKIVIPTHDSLMKMTKDEIIAANNSICSSVEMVSSLSKNMNKDILISHTMRNARAASMNM